MYVEESNVYKLPKIPNLKDNSNTPRSKIRYDILRISQEKSRENILIIIDNSWPWLTAHRRRSRKLSVRLMSDDERIPFGCVM